MPAIRPYRASDLDALYAICLLTGDAGKDATALYRDPKILGEIYAAPYGVFQPECALVAENDEGVAGYILGAPDTRALEARLEAEWWPHLRTRYPDPGPHPCDVNQRAARHIHHPPLAPEEIATRWPAHLHLDLLPRLQGQGLGKCLLDAWLDLMAARGVRGVHLATGSRNARAMKFYAAYGFRELARQGGAVWFGMTLPEK